MKTKKFMLKLAPYLVSVSVGIALYFTGANLGANIGNLLINLSAAFFAIPLIFLFYQVAQNLSKRRLNKEIFDYAKMQIDREILSIINQLMKMVYPYENKDFSQISVNKFLSIKKDELSRNLTENTCLGFQVFKNWEVSENNLHEILKNSYIITRLNDDQIISLISIIQELRGLQEIQQLEDLYIKTDKNAGSYKIVNGKELNKENIKYPDRYLLLQNLGNRKFVVEDFGDVPLYNVEKLLFYYSINSKYSEVYISQIYRLLFGLNNWCNLTGREFVIDTKMFRSKIKAKQQVEV